MDYYNSQYEKAKLIFHENDKFTWNTTSKNSLVLYKDDKPFGKFRVKKIAKVQNSEWTWSWKMKDDYIDHNFYPKNLRSKIPKLIRNTKESFPKIVHALEALNGMWYIYLEEENIINVIIIRKICKLY